MCSSVGEAYIVILCVCMYVCVHTRKMKIVQLYNPRVNNNLRRNDDIGVLYIENDYKKQHFGF